MKKDGKVTEVMNETKSIVTHNATLPNLVTVHPAGSVDDIDGNKKQLNEGDYISFVDGRIRKLSARHANATVATTTTAKTSTSKPAKSTRPKKSTGNR